MAISELINHDSMLRGRLMLALQAAIIEHFGESEWKALGYQIGMQDYITNHKRLLRSMSWGDPDYAGNVLDALDQFWRHAPQAFDILVAHPELRPHLESCHADVLSDLGLGFGHVPAPLPTSATDVVRLALADSEHLLQVSKPVSAVDRLHTALHGYLRSICVQGGVTASDGASVTQLFKLVRSHPVFAVPQHQEELNRILSGLSTVVDAVNTLRNHASVAHANESLLDDAEARLVVNAMRALFHYLFAKLG